MANSPSFDIVLPCYNPQLGWDKLVTECYANLRSMYPDHFKTLIIVNDGSTCPMNIDQLKKSIPELVWVGYPRNQGKGYALRQGVTASTADFCFYTDLDFPFGIQFFETGCQNLECGEDIVMGIRDSLYYKKLPIRRWIISNATNLMTRLILRIPFKDTQAGFKGFNSKGRELFLKTSINSFLFDTEFIMLAHRNQLKISTIKVTPNETVHFSSMNSGVLKKELFNFIQLLKR